MSKSNATLKLTISLLVAGILSACGNSLQLQTSSTDEGGNAEGYPGGDELTAQFAGRYFFQKPGYTCVNEKREVVASHKYEIEINRLGKISVYSNGCNRKLTGSSTTLRNLDFAPYNADYLTKGSQIFTRDGLTEFAGEYTSVMAICRRIERDGSGIDIVWIQTQSSKTNLALIYTGQRQGHTLSTKVYEPVEISEVREGTITSLKAPGFSLTIDSSLLLSKGTYDQGAFSYDTDGAHFFEPVVRCSTPFDNFD